MSEAESYDDHETSGPKNHDPNMPKRENSDVHLMMLFDVPLEYENIPIEGTDQIQLGKDTGIRQLRRAIKWTKVLCLVGTAFLVAIILLVIPKSKSSTSPVISSEENSQQSTGSSNDTDLQETTFQPTKRPSCNDRFVDCVGDRLSHDQLLEAGDAICSTDHQFEMGVDINGSLMWQNCTSSVYIEFFQGKRGYSFMLDSNGDFIINDEFGTTTKRWQCKENVPSSKRCFGTKAGKRFDCPFLHIHRKEGRVVLNWEKNNRWHQTDIEKLYELE